MRKRLWALSVLFVPALVFAHHSFNATFNPREVVEIEGVVTKVIWRNPHVRLEVEVDGEVWDIETHSVSILSRMEVGPELIDVGDPIRLAGNPARRSENGLFALHALLEDGNEIVLDPGGSPRWTDAGKQSSEYWLAPEVDSEGGGNGIFQVWSTVLADSASFPLFPHGFDPGFDVATYGLTPDARRALEAFDPYTDSPTADCAPKGMPTIMEQPYPMEIMEAGGDIVLRLEEYDTVRTVHMSPAEASTDQAETLLGYSVGRWEGETLVVETSNSSWRHFDTVGVPLSDEAKITEWFTPSADGSRLNYRLRVVDAATFERPIEFEKYWLAVPGTTVEPYECTK